MSGDEEKKPATGRRIGGIRSQYATLGAGPKPVEPQSTSPQVVLPTNQQVELPTSSFTRETTKPQTVLPESGEDVLSTSRFVDKTTNQEVDKTISQQVEKTTSPLVDKTAKPQVEKYTTHLRPETIRAIKLYAVTHDMKDYEVAQMLFDLAFKELENREES